MENNVSSSSGLLEVIVTHKECSKICAKSILFFLVSNDVTSCYNTTMWQQTKWTHKAFIFHNLK